MEPKVIENWYFLPTEGKPCSLVDKKLFGTIGGEEKETSRIKGRLAGTECVVTGSGSVYRLGKSSIVTENYADYKAQVLQELPVTTAAAPAASVPAEDRTATADGLDIDLRL